MFVAWDLDEIKGRFPRTKGFLGFLWLHCGLLIIWEYDEMMT